MSAQLRNSIWLGSLLDIICALLPYHTAVPGQCLIAEENSKSSGRMMTIIKRFLLLLLMLQQLLSQPFRYCH